MNIIKLPGQILSLIKFAKLSISKNVVNATTLVWTCKKNTKSISGGSNAPKKRVVENGDP